MNTPRGNAHTESTSLTSIIGLFEFKSPTDLILSSSDFSIISLFGSKIITTS